MLSSSLTAKIKQRDVFVAGEFGDILVCFILCGYRNKYWCVCTPVRVTQWRVNLDNAGGKEGCWGDALELTEKDEIECTNGLEKGHISLRPMMNFPQGSPDKGAPSCNHLPAHNPRGICIECFLHRAAHIFQRLFFIQKYGAEILPG